MFIRELIGSTVAALVAVGFVVNPGPESSPGAVGAWSVADGAVPVTAMALHPCPATSESECRAVFLPPLASNDDDGAAHTSHQPEVRICGPLEEGVSWQSVTDCDQGGTGPDVEHFPFGCGNINECVEVTSDHYQANWHTPSGEGDEDEGDEDDDDADEDDEADEDDDEGGKGKGKGGDEDDDDDEDEDDEDDEGDGDGLENGYYLINVRLNGVSAGGVVVELGQGGGGGSPPKFNMGSTVPIKFRLHDKIIG